MAERPISHAHWQAAEVEWYLKNGRHRRRIATDSTGALYVIADEAWNRLNPSQQECVDRIMEGAILRAAAEIGAKMQGE